MNEEVASTRGGSTTAPNPPLKVFINYRRVDSSGDARLLYELLAQRLGADNVFLDAASLKPGMDWLQEIDAHDSTCAAFLVLIGSRWEESFADRSSVGGPSPDVARREIEFALSRESGVSVLPVLIDDAPMPAGAKLPRSLRRLASIQGVQLRHSTFDNDLDHLVDVLSQLPPTMPTPPPAPSPAPPAPQPAVDDDRTARNGAPDQRHYRRLLRYMVDEASVVVLLGSRANSNSDQGAGPRNRPPSARELAVELARRFQLSPSPDDLALVAQQICVTSGRPDLYRTLQQLLPVEPEPGAVHRFLARLPAQIERLTSEQRYPLIVTTNFDSALERAFDAEQEPYDLAVYMATGDDEGKFVHLPFEGNANVILSPNDYLKFPIAEFGELTRTVIVKIHGAVDGSLGEYRWRQNYLVTEDQHIEYLSRSRIQSLIPVQILDKLVNSHWLFLGYPMADWALRVFVNRVWQGQQLASRSWAVEEDPGPLEDDYWSHVGVEMVPCALADYLSGLEGHLSSHGDTGP